MSRRGQGVSRLFCFTVWSFSDCSLLDNYKDIKNLVHNGGFSGDMMQFGGILLLHAPRLRFAYLG